MHPKKLDPLWIEEVRSRKLSARARKVLEYLIEHGTISTHDIESKLGESHAPRAVADLKDAGVPVVQEGYISVAGKRRGLYRLDPTAPIRAGMTGRTGFSTAFKKRLIEHYGTKCAVCGMTYESRYLQPDHRVPVLVGGDEPDSERQVEDYMPLCRSCNRTKSIECERCPNGTDGHDPEVCPHCFWASPDDYDHVATMAERHDVLVWIGEAEIADRAAAVARAEEAGQTLSEYIKEMLREGPACG
jgi:hypothetical protein